jgi:excisionase family DNA binding protein
MISPVPDLTAIVAAVVAEVVGQLNDRPDGALRLYTPAEAAELLGVTENWVVERCTARTIPCTFVGRFPRLSAAHIRAIAAAGEVDPATRGRRRAA